jgi:hypothetical protein
MAYDLFLRRHTPRDWSLGDEAEGKKFPLWLNVTGVGLAGYLLYSAWFSRPEKTWKPAPGIRHLTPVPVSRRTAKTVKVPMQTMRETVYGRR